MLLCSPLLHLEPAPKQKVRGVLEENNPVRAIAGLSALCALLLAACAQAPSPRPSPALSQPTTSPSFAVSHGVRPATLPLPPRPRIEGTTLYGGVFTPQPATLCARETSHCIEVDVVGKRLSLYRAGRPVVGYAVMTPRAEQLPADIVRGLVTAIDTRPTWCPTERMHQISRTRDEVLPRGCLPYGHPENAMGDAKFIIVWSHGYSPFARIHGTAGYPDDWDTYGTYGCVGLMNGRPHGILGLIDLLGPNAVREGITVFLYRRTRLSAFIPMAGERMPAGHSVFMHLHFTGRCVNNCTNHDDAIRAQAFL